MKSKIGTLGVAVISIFILTACMGTYYFNGSRTGNESRFLMEYTIFDGSDYQMLELEEGDILKAEIVSRSGKISASITKDDKIIYEGKDIQTSLFQIKIQETGTYKVEVTGEKAEGSVSFTKE